MQRSFLVGSDTTVLDWGIAVCLCVFETVGVARSC